MRKFFNRKYTTVAIYTFLVLFAALLFYLLVFNFSSFLSTVTHIVFAPRGIIFGIVIALILFPLAKKLEGFFARRVFRRRERPKLARILAVSLTFFILIICLAVVVVSILPMMYQNYQDLASDLTGYADALVKLIQSNDLIYNFILTQSGLSGETPQEIIQSFVTRYSDLFSSFAGGLFNFIFSFTTIVSDTLVAFILAFYFLLARDTVAAILRKLAVAVLPSGARRVTARFCTRLYTDLMNFLSARLTCSFVIGLLCYGLTWALGVRFYPVISLFALVLNIVPVIGPVLAAAVCTLIVFVAQPHATWIFIILIVALNFLEHHLVERYLLSRRLRPNTALTLVAVIIGYHFFGLGGTLVAVPIFVTLRTEFSLFVDYLLNRKKLPTDISSYLAPLPTATEEAERQDASEADGDEDGEYSPQNSPYPAEDI